ncbi:protein-tyrosine phosphatase-like protein [Aspergillus coremiiformis]|uniref:protein-tyrosine-phosphatase n=1 Tax=Aspergillus coremiiformis TaxID=138285 RepID=A0A5N6ZBP8_9EURO|nr:protein-tyrosine phosphatase-like protein [Aspergillus coremiiformis]
MSDACDFIDNALRSVPEQPTSKDDPQPTQGGGVLVHCGKGISRSATIVIAYLMRTRHMALHDALEMVRQMRRVKPSAAFMDQLAVWEKVEYEIWEDAGERIPKLAYKEYLCGCGSDFG